MLKTLRILAAFALALTAYALLILLLRPPSAQARPAGLSLPDQYTLSAAVGRDQSIYHPAAVSGGLHADNAPQALAADFTAAGVTVRSGTVDWSWQLSAYGYGDRLSPVAPAAPVAAANRVEYRRGAITEWYVNGPLGLQQGFDLAAPPPGGPSANALTLALALGGSGRAKLGVDGQSLSLTGPTGRPLLSYGGLLATDAAGRELPAWLELAGGTLRLRVDDRGARYPLRIDPWMQTAKLIPEDGQSFGQFGRSVAIDGHTVVVGMRDAIIDGKNGQGAAYVFERPSTCWHGSMTQVAKLTAGDGAAGDLFGSSVAISGDTVVVGAMEHNASRGAAYVFVRPPGGWATTSAYSAKLIASDGASSDGMGLSVDISGHTVVAGAYNDDAYSGSAYVFLRPEAGWSGVLTESAKLVAAVRSFARFGAAVAVSGDTIVAGAYQARVGTTNGQGAAYVFERPPAGWSGLLTETARLTLADGETGDWFADSVDIDGPTIVAGSRYANDRRGGGYVFERPPYGWVTTSTYNTRLIPTEEGYYGYGQSVAIDGNAIAVGAVYSSISATNSVYVFDRPHCGWVTTSTYTARLMALDGEAYDSFGGAVAISGRTIVAGADETDVGSYVRQGAAYIYELQPDLVVHGAASSASAAAGDPLTYTLAFSNTGSSIAAGIVLTDVIPAGLLVQDISHSGAAITEVVAAGGVQASAAPLTTIWQVEDLDPNQGGAIVVAGRIDPSLPAGQLTTSAVITSPGDTNPVNNADSTSVTVSGGPASVPPTYLPYILKSGG
jgi:uncharacterized repeat protein (TIGR01451 family)